MSLLTFKSFTGSAMSVSVFPEKKSRLYLNKARKKEDKESIYIQIDRDRFLHAEVAFNSNFKQNLTNLWMFT